MTDYTTMDARVLSHEEMHWKQITSAILSKVGGTFTVNETPIEGYRDGYFRLYINGSPNEFIGVFFKNGSIVTSFSYYNYEYFPTQSKVHNRGGHVRGEKKEVTKYLEFVFNVLLNKKNEQVLTTMEEKLLNILIKRNH